MLTRQSHGGRGGELGELLRGWRALRGKSQLDLALEADVSQRHVSFIESGRSAPGRETLLEIADALDVPLRERNTLLLAAGYAPVYADDGWNEPHMRSIDTAVERMLRQQEPFPAVLMDRYWNVIATNEAAPRFFGRFVDLAARPKPRNMLHLMFDPNGLRPFIRDWETVAQALIGRVRREAIGRVVDGRTRELLDALMASIGPTPSRTRLGTDDLPMTPLSFEKDGVVLSYFSLVSTIGTPTTVMAQELRLECMFPADEATERQHGEFIA